MRYMMRVIKGTYKPTKATRKPGVITPSVVQGTGVSPAMQIMERARIWEERTRMPMSVAYGFAYADVPDIARDRDGRHEQQPGARGPDRPGYVRFHLEETRGVRGKKLPKVQEGVAVAIADAKARRCRLSSPTIRIAPATRLTSSRS
jgi:hypothetical protein